MFNTIALMLVIGIAYLLMGLFALISGRVYGRSWEKYMGGWIYKKSDPKTYWSYTLLALFLGGSLSVFAAVFSF